MTVMRQQSPRGFLAFLSHAPVSPQTLSHHGASPLSIHQNLCFCSPGLGEAPPPHTLKRPAALASERKKRNRGGHEGGEGQEGCHQDGACVPGIGLDSYVDYVIAIPWHGCCVSNGGDEAGAQDPG